MHGDFVFLFQFFNTPGNEIAPGSDIIGIDFKDRFIHHGFILVVSGTMTADGSSGPRREFRPEPPGPRRLKMK